MWRLILPKPRHIVTLAVFSTLLLVALYIIERNSDSYAAAEHFLLTDARVVALVGPPTRVAFQFWRGFEVISSPNTGKASYTFKVSGKKGTAIAQVQLRSSSGEWHVVAANLRAPDGTSSQIGGPGFSP